ncbi:hypothetical protein VTN49DRAFT_94 [Thermomyces lanuginosus]|uniref:uncharacterized protein n=1 Tax=Thermomyces lanuginosus TaxID=5541 RepID=UPI003743070E
MESDVEPVFRTEVADPLPSKADLLFGIDEDTERCYVCSLTWIDITQEELPVDVFLAVKMQRRRGIDSELEELDHDKVKEERMRLEDKLDRLKDKCPDADFEALLIMLQQEETINYPHPIFMRKSVYNKEFRGPWALGAIVCAALAFFRIVGAKPDHEYIISGHVRFMDYYWRVPAFGVSYGENSQEIKSLYMRKLVHTGYTDRLIG